MARWPKGFLVIGDALCHFNPIYAQGMSAAAIQAEILREILSEYTERSQSLDGIAASFFNKAAEFNRTPWDLAAGFDLHSPRPAAHAHRELKTVHATSPLDMLAQKDEGIRRLMIEVFQLVKPLSILQQEPLRSRVTALKH